MAVCRCAGRWFRSPPPRSTHSHWTVVGGDLGDHLVFSCRGHHTTHHFNAMDFHLRTTLYFITMSFALARDEEMMIEPGRDGTGYGALMIGVENNASPSSPPSPGTISLHAPSSRKRSATQRAIRYYLLFVFGIVLLAEYARLGLAFRLGFC